MVTSFPKLSELIIKILKVIEVKAFVLVLPSLTEANHLNLWLHSYSRTGMLPSALGSGSCVGLHRYPGEILVSSRRDKKNHYSSKGGDREGQGAG